MMEIRVLKKWLRKWKEFNFSFYFADFKKTSFSWIACSLGIFIIFQNLIIKYFNKVLVDPIFSFCPKDNYLVDIVFLLFFFFSLFFLIKQLQKNIVPTFTSVIFFLSVYLIKLFYFDNDNNYIFYKYSFSLLNHISYASSFIYSILLFSLSYKSYFNPLVKKQSMYSLLDDNPSIEGYEDIYERSHFAKNIANHILNTSTISSFAIGIIGEWGSGKSDFLLRLKSILDMYPENLIVDFNPWRVKNSDAIIDEFFKSLSKKIQPFNQSITNSIKKYSNSILKNAKETQYRFIDTLFEKWIEEEDLLSQYNSINNAIQFTNKRLIIFIDDIDRLTGSEVMEVLRIIRNTANFSNTFFVIGMDQTYIIDVIRKTKHFSNEDEYLKKVFQLSISLPIFKKEKFASEIAKYLLTDDLSNDDKNKIRNALSRFGFDNSDDLVKLFNSFTNEGLLEQLIDNGRDLRRFCNSFKILFNILKDEADIFDLFILELIRNKNYKVYDKIRTRELLKFKPLNINYFELNEEVWKVNFTDIPDEKVLKNAVETIFSDAKNKTQRKLILPRNFYIYFSYQLFNIISFHEFNLALEKEPDEMINDFKKWLEPKNINEFLNIISYLGESQSLESFKKIII